MVERRQQQRHGASGFTLLELLVVLVIIGILLTMVTISIGGGGDQRQLREEAQRLAALVALASDEAVLKSRELMLAADGNSYAFLAQDDKGKWHPVEESGSLRPREVPQWIHLDIRVDEPLVPESETENKEKKEEPGQVWILSSGEMSPFTVTMSLDNGAEYRLHGDILGNLKLDAPGAEQ